MGKINKPQLVKLITGLISSDTKLFDKVGEQLINKFGEIDRTSDVMNFHHTDYYEKEMGKSLKRRFISFKRLIEIERLPDIKIYTNDIEHEYTDSKDNRKINIDPGYIDLAKLVLASTKDFTHRIYIGKGIYAEVTLRYMHGTYIPWEWTYPDFRTKEYIAFFEEIRKIYISQIKGQTRL